MALSTHYYVLSFGAASGMLAEAFRDCLIDVENQGFPVAAPDPVSQSGDEQLREFARSVDRCFAQYYAREPLRLVVVGDKRVQAAFGSVTAHGPAIVGHVDGDHSATPARDLGQIVWPVVKNAMSGLLDKAMRELEAPAHPQHFAFGLEAVARRVSERVQGMLLVEDGYHMKGTISGTGPSTVVSREVDVRDAMDDAVDVVIEKVLQSGGDVVFAPSGSLRSRIVLLPRGAAGQETGAVGPK